MHASVLRYLFWVLQHPTLLSIQLGRGFFPLPLVSLLLKASQPLLQLLNQLLLLPLPSLQCILPPRHLRQALPYPRKGVYVLPCTKECPEVRLDVQHFFDMHEDGWGFPFPRLHRRSTRPG